MHLCAMKEDLHHPKFARRDCLLQIIAIKSFVQVLIANSPIGLNSAKGCTWLNLCTHVTPN